MEDVLQKLKEFSDTLPEAWHSPPPTCALHKKIRLPSRCTLGRLFENMPALCVVIPVAEGRPWVVNKRFVNFLGVSAEILEDVIHPPGAWEECLDLVRSSPGKAVRLDVVMSSPRGDLRVVWDFLLDGEWIYGIGKPEDDRIG